MINELTEIEEFRLTCPEELFAGYRISATQACNVLFVGESRSGKSTAVKSLMAPNYSAPRRMYSVTRSPQVYHTIAYDDSTKTSNILTLVDTPGLKDYTRDASEKRTDQEILDLVTICIKKEITTLNCICFVISGSEGFNDNHISVFKSYIRYLKAVRTENDTHFSNISMLLVTHADELSSEERAMFQQQFKNDPSLQFMSEFCKLGIFFNAIIPDRYKTRCMEFKDDIVQCRTAFIAALLNQANSPVTIMELKVVVEEFKKDVDSFVSKKIVAPRERGICQIQ